MSIVKEQKVGAIALAVSLLLSVSVPTGLSAEIHTAISELLALPFTNNPLDPRFIELLDSRTIAVCLIDRYRRFVERWEHKVPTNQRWLTENDVEIISFFPSKYVASLLVNGQLNVHQTHPNTMTSAGRKVRADVEDLALNTKLERDYSDRKNAAVHFIRPKYGFLHFLKTSGVSVNPNRWLHYGTVIIVYQNDVKQRTTFTYGDSAYRLTQETAQVKHSTEPRALADLAPPDSKHRTTVWVEAQIFGAIDLADIAEFRIPPYRQDLLEALKPSGLPIFAYDRAALECIDKPIEESCVPVTRTTCLYSGDKQRMETYRRQREQRAITLQ